MSNRKLYRETFSQVHGSVRIRWEDYQVRKHQRTVRRLAVLAAAVALTAVLSGLALAANFFGLRDALLPEKHTVNVVDENGVVVPGKYELKDFVSLSGYIGTPESQALAEWQAFLEGYDRDGSIVSGIGNAPTGFEEDYGLYTVYTQEMADTLDSIVEKYGLRLHTRMEIVLPAVWPETVGAFMKENNTALSGYIYEDGTFRYDGEADIPGYGKLEYQFSRSVRGSFNDVTLNIGDLSDFQEWGCQTEQGTSVTLGLGAHTRSLILADLGDCFILVNVLAGEERDDVFSSGAIGRAELEALADSFDFDLLSPVKTPDLAAVAAASEQALEELNAQPAPEEGPELPAEEDPLYARTGIESNAGREFVLDLAELLEEDRRVDIAALLAYPVQVETAEGTFEASGPEEFLEYYDETIGQNREGLAADLGWAPEPFANGSGLISAAGGAVWFGLVEDGDIRIFTLQTDQWSIRPAGGIGIQPE